MNHMIIILDNQYPWKTVQSYNIIIQMRNFSKDNKRNYCKEAGVQRTLTGQKVMFNNNLKETQVRVGKYKYDTTHQLGHGYSSKVYKGVEILRPHMRYAVKVINLKKFKGLNLDMLQMQINIHRCLNNQNIVKLHEAVKTSHHYYLILEYCPHGNLSEYIAQKKKLTETHALDIITQILNGYKYLLKEDIIHRDIKPANILRVGNKWKISDFGFAVKSKFAFKDRMNVGTPLYMAPESIKRSFYSYKSDLYSLGIVFYQMLQGVTPHQAQTQKQLLQLLNHDIQVPESIKHPKLIDLLSKLCQINQSKRMSRQMIENYTVGTEQSRLNEMINSTVSLKQRKNSLVTNDSIDKKDASIKSNHSHASSNKKIQSKSQEQTGSMKSFDQPKASIKNQAMINKQILLVELDYVNYLYTNIKNIEAFLLQETSKQILVLTLFKLLLKLMRSLCNKEESHPQIKNWAEFVNTKIYQEISSSFTNCSEKYQKQYLEFIKYNDIKIIRMVNRKFPQLSQQSPLSTKFYENFRNFICGIIKEQSNEVIKLINNCQEQLNDCFQAFKNLSFLFKVSQLRISKDNGFRQKPLTVTCFNESKLQKHDFYKLERQMKNHAELLVLAQNRL